MPAKFFAPNLALQNQLEGILEAVWLQFPDVAQNQLAVTWIPYEPPYRVNTGGALSVEDFWQYCPQGASYRGVELFVPGRLAHLFYLVALHDWLEQKMVQPSDEIERALTDMMASEGSRTNHDAASYVVDVLSGTTSGPSLPPGPAETWASQRNIINRYFAQLGWLELRSINLNQKTWNNGPYGREYDFLGKTLENQNQLTTESAARLLHSIVGGVSVSSMRSQQMMNLIERSSSLQRLKLGLDVTQIWLQESVDESGAHVVAYIEDQTVHPYLLAVFSEPSKGGKQISQDSIRTSQSFQLIEEYDSDEVSRVVEFIAQKIFVQSQQNFLES